MPYGSPWRAPAAHALLAGVSEVACQPEHARAVLRRAKAGGQGRNRTSDTRIFSAVLYQLSYLASVSFSGRAETREYNIGALIEAVPTR